MLDRWKGNEVKAGDVVLVWRGSGGLGGQAIQLVKNAGARAVAVVSNAERGEYCVKLGALGYINRREYKHWGIPPHWEDSAGQKEWQGEARRLGQGDWGHLGECRKPPVPFEQPRG